MRRVLSLLVAAAAVAGCYGKTPDADKVPLSEMPAAAPGAAQAAPADAGRLAGPVLEVLSAPPYTYLHVKTPQGDVWAAVPEAKIAKGDEVNVFNPMLMTKFESKTLKRTFDEVYFGTLTPDGGAAMGAGDNPHAGVATPSAPVKIAKVDKAAGADGRTIAEAWTQLATLEGKTIAVRGTVVKFNGGVMGKNWIHLQDGSGDAAKGNNDITVTSMDEAAVGQVITVRGKVKTNQDFGSGYKYAIIVEDAKIVK